MRNLRIERERGSLTFKIKARNEISWWQQGYRGIEVEVMLEIDMRGGGDSMDRE